MLWSRVRPLLCWCWLCAGLCRFACSSSPAGYCACRRNVDPCCGVEAWWSLCPCAVLCCRRVRCCEGSAAGHAAACPQGAAKLCHATGLRKHQLQHNLVSASCNGICLYTSALGCDLKDLRAGLSACGAWPARLQESWPQTDQDWGQSRLSLSTNYASANVLMPTTCRITCRITVNWWHELFELHSYRHNQVID